MDIKTTQSVMSIVAALPYSHLTKVIEITSAFDMRLESSSRGLSDKIGILRAQPAWDFAWR